MLNIEEREMKNQEFIECSCIAFGAIAVGAVGYALWVYVSPWTVIVWAVLNVLWVTGAAYNAIEYRRMIRRLRN